MQDDAVKDARRQRDRDGARFVLGALVLALILGAGIGALLIQPAPVRLAGWTFIGPNNRQNITLSNAYVQVASNKPNQRWRYMASVQKFGPQWKPTPKLQVLSPKVYHYGFFTLIQQ